MLPGKISTNHLYTRNPHTGTLAYSEDPDEVHQGLHCLPRQNRYSRKKKLQLLAPWIILTLLYVAGSLLPDVAIWKNMAALNSVARNLKYLILHDSIV